MILFKTILGQKERLITEDSIRLVKAMAIIVSDLPRASRFIRISHQT
jgi:hypothetical protein